MSKRVYGASQLPGYISPEYVEWNLDECNVRITRQENGKVKLSGEWLEWDEAADDWKSQPMTRNEVVQVMHDFDLVLPHGRTAKHLKTVYQIKPATSPA